MKVDEFLTKKVELQKQLDAVNGEIAKAKAGVLAEIKRYITEFGISKTEIIGLFGAGAAAPARVRKKRGRPFKKA